MAKLKSLRKAGTRAIRKLFGREPSVASADANSSSEFDEDNNPNNNNNNTTKPITADNHHLNNHNNHRVDGPVSTSHSPSATTKNNSKYDSIPGDYTNGTMAMRSISQAVRPAKQPVHRLEQNGNKDKERNANSPDSDKENLPPPPAIPDLNNLTDNLEKLGLGDEYRQSLQAKSTEANFLTEEDEIFNAEQARHLDFIQEALDMARLALKINETPVGCVLVHNDQVIARGMNATNVTRNGTRHAEFMALSALLSYPPKDGPRTTCLKPKVEQKFTEEADDDASIASPQPDEGNEDGSKSHLYPYGQKEHPDYRVDREILRESILYVTVEPCVMCASLLRQLGIKKVYFGAVNDKFGGTGGVFSIHANSLPVRDDGQTASAHPQPPPMRLPGGGQVLGTSFPPSGGDGGNIEPGYEIEGGWGRDEAVALLRRFYVQENGRAPVPRKKEGRAARLAAMMEKDDGASEISGSASGGTIPDGDDLMPASADEGGNPFDGDNDRRPGSGHVEIDESFIQ